MIGFEGFGAPVTFPTTALRRPAIDEITANRSILR
jgi:hypothetical protein